MGIDTTIHGCFTCDIDDLDDDFDIGDAWNTFKKNNDDETDICWNLVGDHFEANENFRVVPEFYVKGWIYICKNFLEPNGIAIYENTLGWSCCVCGTMVYGAISVTDECIKLIKVREAEITIKKYDYEGVKTTIKECDLEKLNKKLNDRDKEISILQKRIEELETEIKYSPDGIGYQETKEHFDKLLRQHKKK